MNRLEDIRKMKALLEKEGQLQNWRPPPKIWGGPPK